MEAPRIEARGIIEQPIYFHEVREESPQILSIVDSNMVQVGDFPSFGFYSLILAFSLHVSVNMKTTINSLLPAQRELARDLWQALYYAPSPDHLEQARQTFERAPAEVRQAILITTIKNWKTKPSFEAERNPFD